MQQTNYAIELFEKAGFTDTYREDTESFYQNYFDSTLKMHEFFCMFLVQKNDWVIFQEG